MSILRQLVVVLILSAGGNAFAQDHTEVQSQQGQDIFTIVEKMPQFPGGRDSLVAFLIKNFEYPEVDRNEGREGKVYLSFVVETDGSVTEVNPVGKVEEMATKTMVQEAMRIVNLMPPFEPGEQRGKKVRCRYTLPIVFKLQ